MRLALGLSLLIVSLTVYRLLAQVGPPPRSRPAPGPHAPPPPPRQVMYQHDFEGLGETVQDAQHHALEQARTWMASEVPLGWAPDADHAVELLQREMVTFDEPREVELPRSGLMKVVTAHLTITKRQAEEILQRVRQERSAERSKVLARVLAGLVGLLLVAGGYLRLEEATRGYYTMGLRAVALGLLLAVLGVCIMA